MLARARRLAVLAGLTLMPACATLAPRPTPADLAHAPARTPPITIANLERGRSLYLGRCASCHRPFEPTSKSAGDWPNYVDKMKQRARLSGEDAALVVDYLVTMAHL